MQKTWAVWEAPFLLMIFAGLSKAANAVRPARGRTGFEFVQHATLPRRAAIPSLLRARVPSSLRAIRLVVRDVRQGQQNPEEMRMRAISPRRPPLVLGTRPDHAQR